MSWSVPHTFSVGEVVTASTMNTYVTDNIRAIAPLGSYIYLHQAATTVETLINGGWLECNGAAVSRSTYATLFGLVSTSYGAGDGSTTFNVPNLSGRMPVGLGVAGTHHSDVTALGGSEGAAASARRPKHYHTYAKPTNSGDAQGGGGGVLPFNTFSGTLNTSGTAGPLDAPAYLVAGVWGIKFS